MDHPDEPLMIPIAPLDMKHLKEAAKTLRVPTGRLLHMAINATFNFAFDPIDSLPGGPPNDPLHLVHRN